MVEKKVADTILQSTFEVELGGVTYTVAPPRTATIIRLSELSARLPLIETDEYLTEVLSKGKDAKVIGDIVALLVCGEIPPLRIYNIPSIIAHWKRNRRFRKVRRLSLYSISPRDLMIVLSKILGRQEITDFFTLIVSLRSANILKRTRGTTASGRQSEQPHNR